MSAISASIFTVCVVLVAIELLCRFVSKSNVLQFIRGLITAMLLISLVAAFMGLDFDFSALGADEIQENEELSAYLDDAYQQTVQNETASYIDGLLATIEINAKEIDVFTDNDDDGSIIIEKIQIAVQDDTDRTRANALLKNVLDEGTDVEVYVK